MKLRKQSCDKTRKFVSSSSEVTEETCVGEEGKGRGFLPSRQVTRERSRRHKQRKRDGGGEKEWGGEETKANKMRKEGEYCTEKEKNELQGWTAGRNEKSG